MFSEGGVQIGVTNWSEIKNALGGGTGNRGGRKRRGQQEETSVVWQ